LDKRLTDKALVQHQRTFGLHWSDCQSPYWCHWLCLIPSKKGVIIRWTLPCLWEATYSSTRRREPWRGRVDNQLTGSPKLRAPTPEGLIVVCYSNKYIHIM